MVYYFKWQELTWYLTVFLCIIYIDPICVFSCKIRSEYFVYFFFYFFCNVSLIRRRCEFMWTTLSSCYKCCLTWVEFHLTDIFGFLFFNCGNLITLMYSLRLQVPVLRSMYRHQLNPWLPVTLFAGVEHFVAFALVAVVQQKSFVFASVVAVVNYPTLRASFVRSLLQLELIHGPRRDYYSP